MALEDRALQIRKEAALAEVQQEYPKYFDALKVQTCWTGHYEYNMLDHNGIVGFHPQVTNFMFANGFSGHGLQQSPAVGRGVAEWIVHGGYQTLDLSPLGWGRVLAGQPLVERNVI